MNTLATFLAVDYTTGKLFKIALFNYIIRLNTLIQHTKSATIIDNALLMNIYM